MPQCPVCSHERHVLPAERVTCGYCRNVIKASEIDSRFIDFANFNNVRSIKGMMVFFTILLIVEIIASFLILAAAK